jgi:hypothetical protein
VGRLLCIGFYPYDVVHLLTIAREAHHRLDLDPVFVSVAWPDVAVSVVEQVSAEGFETLDCKVMADEVSSVRNPFQRYRQQRQATNRLMDELLAEVQPTAVLASVNPPPGLFLDESARRGLPTILLQLFHWGDRAFYRELHADDRRQHDAGLTGKSRVKRRVERRLQSLFRVAPYVAWDLRHATIAVQGPATQRRLVSEGIPREHVVVTGNPALDDLHRLRDSANEARARLGAQLGLAGGDTTITHMRSHEDRLVGLDRTSREQSQAQIVHALRSAAPDAQIIVKIHPKEDERDKTFVRSIDPNLLVVGDEVSTNDILAASDVVVGTLSTTLLYSALLDRPTVAAWLWPGLDYWRASTDWSGVDRVFSEEALTEAVRRHLHDAEYQAQWQARRRDFVTDEFAFDGGSTARLVDLLGGLVNEPSTTSAARQR